MIVVKESQCHKNNVINFQSTAQTRLVIGNNNLLGNKWGLTTRSTSSYRTCFNKSFLALAGTCFSFKLHWSNMKWISLLKDIMYHLAQESNPWTLTLNRRWSSQLGYVSQNNGSQWSCMNGLIWKWNISDMVWQITMLMEILIINILICQTSSTTITTNLICCVCVCVCV